MPLQVQVIWCGGVLLRAEHHGLDASPTTGEVLQFRYTQACAQKKPGGELFEQRVVSPKADVRARI